MFRRVSPTPEPPGDRPLVFLHIPKTGGTSLIQNLSSQFRPDRQFTQEGNISSELLSRLARDMRTDYFVYGHGLHGIGRHLGEARTATLFREPERHAVSNYFFVRRNPDLPHHREACALNFRDFVHHVWKTLVFQSVSLDVVLSDHTIEDPSDFFRRLPGIQAFLDSIDFVGTLDGLEAFTHRISMFYRSAPRPVSRLNTAQDAGVEAAEMDAAVEVYRSLWRDPGLAPLLAAEAGLYAQARRRVAREASAAWEAPRRTRPIRKPARFAAPAWLSSKARLN